MRFPVDDDALKYLGRQMSIPVVDLWSIDIDTKLLSEFPAEFLRRRRIIPFEKRDGRLRVATADPYDITAFDDLRMQTGLKIEPVLARESAILYMLRTYLSASERDPSG